MARRMTMADVKRIANAAGSYYFDRGNSRFFGGDKFWGPYVGPGGVFFVQHNKAGWNIKRQGENGHIEPVRYEGSVGYGGEAIRSHAQKLAKGRA